MTTSTGTHHGIIANFRYGGLYSADVLKTHFGACGMLRSVERHFRRPGKVRSAPAGRSSKFRRPSVAETDGRDLAHDRETRTIAAIVHD